MSSSYKKMYIAVLDCVPDHMVPVLVAHSVLGAHECFSDVRPYEEWYADSFRKVVVRVSQKEFEKISNTLNCYLGYENTVENGSATCAVVEPVDNDQIPNVLKFTKLWAPKN